MNIEKIKNKKCFIFPYSTTSELFCEYLAENGAIVKGFIDNNKKSQNIYLLNDISKEEFDFIFIYSPNHFREIYAQTVKIVDKNKIRFVKLDAKIQYSITKKIDTQNLLDKYFLNRSRQYNLQNEILLIGLGFIDLNIKYLYLHLRKNTKIAVYLATDNQSDINLFKTFGIEVVDINSKKFIDLICQCKIKVIDHSPVDKAMISYLKIGKVVQLWHGITVKMLGTQTNYKALKYDIVLSTSKYVTKYSFAKLYDYDKIIHCGYPRNDLFIDDEIEFINIDIHLLKEMRETSLRYVVYMPTYRPLGFKQNPIDYKKLNEFGKNNNIKFIIKMHPFIAQKTRESLDKYQDLDDHFTNLVIYPANMDIYPILKYSDLLLVDYSSVFFDYLFLNKPIVFFPYDYDQYEKSADGFMIDYYEHIAGDICYDFTTMMQMILKNLDSDRYAEKRKQLFYKMFQNINKKSSELIVDELGKLF